MTVRDAWRLAVGTLTALPTAPPSAVTSATAAGAVALAPFALLPLGLGVVLVGVVGSALGLPPLVLGFLAVGLLALGTRVFHWDGLSDTADGLTASYDRERSLQVMKSGTSGPAGVMATVVVAGLQVAGFAALLPSYEGALVAGLVVCLSRLALTLTCRRGVPAARRDGLGQPMAEVVALDMALLGWLAAAAALTALTVVLGFEWWRAPLALALMALVVLALVRRTRQRFGGVTGDVFGAAIELSLATLLISLV